jgi:hypothetical protein
MEGLYVRGVVSRSDIENMYEAMYLSAFTKFEVLIEDLFVGLLTKKIRPVSGVLPHVAVKSPPIARKIVFGGKSYVDWFPFDKTEKLAKVFFNRGRPFTRLDKNDKQSVQILVFVRNAIAHKSRHAIRIFREEVLGDLNLLPRERTPSGFLRSQFRTMPSQTRFEFYMAEMANLASKICAK